MAKRLRTTSALAVVVMILVGACASSSASPSAGSVRRGERAAPSAAASAAASASAAAERAGFGRAGGSRAGGPDRLHRAGHRRSAPTSRSTARRSRSRRSGSAARAPTSPPRSPTSRRRPASTIQIDSIGSSHETVLKTRIEGGKPPDLAMLAQPTAVLAYAAAGQGHRRRARSWMPAKLSDEHPATIGLVTQGDNIWGIPYKADVKSTIWYPIKAFAAKGYTVPTTWDELIALSDKIVADGSQPVVRQRRRPRHRDRLAAHRLGRGSGPQDQGPAVLQRLDQPQGQVRGSRASRPPSTRSARSSSRRTTSSAATRRSSPPGPEDGRWIRCSPTTWRTRSAGCRRSRPGTARTSSRISGPAASRPSTSSATDVGIFPFPTIDPAQKNAEGSADTLMVLADRPEVRAVAEFLATPEGLQNWIERRQRHLDQHDHPCRLVCRHLQAQGRVRYREQRHRYRLRRLRPHAAARSAPEPSGPRWIDWVNNGGTNTDAVLKAIDDSWPAS